MKNITKIIESNQQILDKCAYWFDTEKEVLKRYTQGVWKPITSTSSLSFSPLSPLSLEEDEAGKKTLQLNYSSSDFKLNDDNELTIKNSGSKAKYYPKADYTIVQWCPKGKIDLDNDLSMPFIIPVRDRCPMIRFYCKELWNKYKMNTSITAQAKVTYVFHDLVEDARQTILNNLTVVNQQLTKPYVCHGPFITWKIQNKEQDQISCNCRKYNPYSYINGDCMASSHRVSWITTQDPVITSHIKQTFNVDICPYITFRNPFTVYGGQVIVKNFTIKNNKITLEFVVEKIPANSKYYNPSTQSLVEYNDDGIQCKGSYVTKKRMIIFSVHGHNNRFQKIKDINLYNNYTRNNYYLTDRHVSSSQINNIQKFTIVNKHVDSRKFINLNQIPSLGILAKWAVNYSRWQESSCGNCIKFAIQDVDSLYKKYRTGSEYTERYKMQNGYGLKYLGVL